jgi:hypothetical protein
MYLKTIGKPFKVQLKICKEAIKFYGKQLLGENLYHKVEITLEFDKSLSGKNEYAYCEWEDNNYRAKEFTITVDPSLGKRNMLLALAHEMVHVKQYAKGELKDYARSNKTKWKTEVIDPDKVDYWDFPWEIEAHGREKGLYVRYMQQKGNN